MYVVQIFISMFCVDEHSSVVTFTLKVYTKYSCSFLTCFYLILKHFSWTNINFSLAKICYLLHCLCLLRLTLVPAVNRQNGMLLECVRLSVACQIAVTKVNCVLGSGKCQVCFKRDPVYMGENCSGVF